MGENAAKGSLVTPVTMSLTKEFLETVWARYHESVRPYSFPIIDTLWFADERFLLPFYRMMMNRGMTIPEKALTLEDIMDQYEETFFGAPAGEFEFYLERATIAAVENLRLVHGIPEQQAMFLEEGAGQRMLSYIYPQREVW